MTRKESLHLINWLRNLTSKEFYLKTPDDLVNLYIEENSIRVECIQCNYKHIFKDRSLKTHGALTTYHCPVCSQQGYHIVKL